LTYTPRPNFWGADTFTYIITDRSFADTATVTVTFAAANDVPFALTDHFTIPEDNAATNLPVLANDTDADADVLSISAVATPAFGTQRRRPSRVPLGVRGRCG